MAASPTADTTLLAGDPRRRRRERRIHALFLAMAVLSVVISGLIVLSLVGNAVSFLSVVDLRTLADIGWFPRRGYFDIRTLIVSSTILSVIAMVVAVPLGLAAAVFLSEYASVRVRKVVKPVLEILAGIPSVVLGFFALTFINQDLVARLFDGAQAFNLLSAGIGVGILVTPLMASVSEDALSAVPMSLREASVGLGARKRTTTLKIVLPAALSGIVAAFIIAFSRAVGETMVATIAGGNSGIFTMNPLDGSLTMPAAIANVAVGTDAVAGDQLAVPSLYFVGLVLFLITLGLNMLGTRIVRKYRKAY